MRLAIVSDIHGNLAALEAVATDIQRQGVDQTVNLGDSLSGPLLPRETAQFLMAQGWLSLAGNHERQLLADAPYVRSASDAYALAQLTTRELDWVRSLASTHQLTPEILLCHGTPRSDVEYCLETIEDHAVRAASAAEVQARVAGSGASLIACGHTHVPRICQVLDGQCVVNPGSVGLPAYADDYPVAHVVENGSPHARYAIVESSPTGWQVSLRSQPYDHRAMARLARANGRLKWEHALLTGYMP